MLKKTENLESFKNAANEYCFQFVELRKKRILDQIHQLETSLNSETKSSAGDKHETGRAMIQLEREKLGNQLSQIEKTQRLLYKVPINRNTQSVGLGNLVITDLHSYYIAISAGELKLKDRSIFCISAATPIGQLVLGKSVGEVFQFNGKQATIMAIY